MGDPEGWSPIDLATRHLVKRSVLTLQPQWDVGVVVLHPLSVRVGKRLDDAVRQHVVRQVRQELQWVDDRTDEVVEPLDLIQDLWNKHKFKEKQNILKFV